MLGFIKAYRYALETIKNLNISKETQEFLLVDYNDRLRMEYELFKKNIKMEHQDKKMQNLCQKLDLYIESEIAKVKSRKEKMQEER